MLLIGAVAYQAKPVLELHFASPQEYAAEGGGVRKVSLPDGTRLTLAGGAKIEVRYTRHDRTVELSRGALYAHVTHDARRPFRINTPNARIVDIGTSFEVLSKPGDTRVRVTSGVVDFGRNGWFSRPIRLKEKQAAILEGASLRRLADVDPTAVARWRNEWVEYKGAPLRQVIADLEALSLERIEIADDALAKKPVSGRIRLSDPTGQIENLAITHDFRIHQASGTFILDSK
ncbi:FecR family protein [Sphingobium sp. CR28]|uniref:FecR family protein n=1 Tax=Sphingobium sp. CR28 TaxID=3400272 RepID=UPI003FEE9BD8